MPSLKSPMMISVLLIDAAGMFPKINLGGGKSSLSKIEGQKQSKASANINTIGVKICTLCVFTINCFGKYFCTLNNYNLHIS